MMVLRELMYFISRISRRSKFLYNISFKIWKIYCKHSKTWWFEGPNYLGRTYIVRRIPDGSEFYKFEKFGIKWNVSYV